MNAIENICCFFSSFSSESDPFLLTQTHAKRFLVGRRDGKNVISDDASMSGHPFFLLSFPPHDRYRHFLGTNIIKELEEKGSVSLFGNCSIK